jgi:hypothetical protein
MIGGSLNARAVHRREAMEFFVAVSRSLRRRTNERAGTTLALG